MSETVPFKEQWAVCPVCDREPCVGPKGRLRKHKRPGLMRPQWCTGSGWEATPEAIAAAESRMVVTDRQGKLAHAARDLLAALPPCPGCATAHVEHAAWCERAERLRRLLLMPLPPPPAPCARCKDEGRVECPSCHGSGMLACGCGKGCGAGDSCDDPRECEVCEWDARVPCPACAGDDNRRTR